MHQELAIAFCSENWRFNQTNRTKANCRCSVPDLIQHPSVLRRISYYAAASNFTLPDFKLRLDQRNAIGSIRETRPNCGKDFGQRDKRNINRRELKTNRELAGVQVARVNSFEHHHSWVL